MTPQSTITAAAGVCACVAAAVLLTAGKQADADPAAAQGMTVVLDRENGGFRSPTAEEAARYAPPAAATPKTSDQERLTRRADGSESLRLDDRYMTYVTVTRNAAGEWEEHCRLDHDHESAHAAARQASSKRAVQ